MDQNRLMEYRLFSVVDTQKWVSGSTEASRQTKGQSGLPLCYF